MLLKVLKRLKVGVRETAHFTVPTSEQPSKTRIIENLNPSFWPAYCQQPDRLPRLCPLPLPQMTPSRGKEPLPLVVTLPERTKPVAGNSGRVVGVHDGDTLTVLTAGNVQLKIRLVEIDAPEIKQPFGQQSKQALSALVFGKDVEIRATGKDRYGRTLARVFVDGADVNLAMVKAGMAWRFDKYSKDGAFQTAQEEAQKVRRGLWADVAPVAPWEWRKQGK